jgi:hypothetical protein
MDEKKRRQPGDSDNSRQDSNDGYVKKDRGNSSDVTDWNRPPRPDKSKDRDDE